MYPRLRIDISWADLARATGYCLGLGRRGPQPAVATGQQPFYSLSVRSAFDQLLAALALPAGSRVLLSEVTVPHMARIVREHGLEPVAVSVDPRTLSIDVCEVERLLTPEAKVLVAAHLFGTRMPLEPLGTLCQQRGVLLVEDCAQALTTGRLSRDPAADVALFSFGPIKTATALGGGVALVADPALRHRMQEVGNEWPRQRTTAYLGRVAKLAGLKLLSTRPVFSALVWLVDHLGGDADAFVGHSARGFPDDRLLACLRQQPCRALEKLIAHRLGHFDSDSIAMRTSRGRELAIATGPTVEVAGADNPTHTYWVFPAICPEPAAAVAALRRAGFDASQHSGLTVLEGRSADHWFDRTVFIPHGRQVPERELARIGLQLNLSQAHAGEVCD